uniref:Uncharacterized protein n=1 Tax=Romanomermis culicivorax TaxID=13658 RepID=A0A915IKS4_ROMCU
MDYLEGLQDQIQQITFLLLIPAPPVPHPVQITQTAPVVAQTAPVVAQPVLLLPVAQLPPTVPLDVQPPQVLTTLVLTLDRHSQPIRKPG